MNEFKFTLKDGMWFMSIDGEEIMKNKSLQWIMVEALKFVRAKEL